MMPLRAASTLHLVLARRLDHRAGTGVDDGGDATGLRIQEVALHREGSLVRGKGEVAGLTAPAATDSFIRGFHIKV
jgi:hypothetical protein